MKKNLFIISLFFVFISCSQIAIVPESTPLEKDFTIDNFLFDLKETTQLDLTNWSHYWIYRPYNNQIYFPARYIDDYHYSYYNGKMYSHEIKITKEENNYYIGLKGYKYLISKDNNTFKISNDIYTINNFKIEANNGIILSYERNLTN